MSPSLLGTNDLAGNTDEQENRKTIDNATTKEATVEADMSFNNENIQPDNQVKLIDLNPLPKITEKTKQSRASLKSEIVTGTPYKNQLEEKRREEENKARKRVKPINLDSQLGPSGTNRNSKKKKKNTNSMDIICGPKLSNKKKRKITRNKESIYCPICKEKYDDPPTEDWIQCSTCKKWFHEECTAYVGGAFTCDFCDRS